MKPVHLSGATRRFFGLEQDDFLKLEHGAYLKGLLRPFNGNRDLAAWASQCLKMRDDMIVLAQKNVLAPANLYPFRLLPIYLAQQTTGAGTVFLRWRRQDRSAMGVALWHELLGDESTPATLVDDLYAMELQRIVLNMQISVLHTLSRQADECASKMAQAHDAYLRRMAGSGPVPDSSAN
ncbi:DUF3158 family protein [Pseudomonas aeruginosa]|uniref:DUF3158 family protein n=1 Tax=Pseudomonas aeruginosa TaxID=287 RepID=UPI000F7E7987|nr:DUF3158 family protein [Pseudomonas aeruginosa]RTB44087.1 DUF3158 family protein [Pseudomonas aeruginosa]